MVQSTWKKFPNKTKSGNKKEHFSGQYYESDNSGNLEKTKRLVIITTP